MPVDIYAPVALLTMFIVVPCNIDDRDGRQPTPWPPPSQSFHNNPLIRILWSIPTILAYGNGLSRPDATQYLWIQSCPNLTWIAKRQLMQLVLIVTLHILPNSPKGPLFLCIQKSAIIALFQTATHAILYPHFLSILL